MTYNNRVRETRNALAKLGLVLNKARGRDGFMIINARYNFVVAGNDNSQTYTYSLSDVEAWLADQKQ